MERPKARLVPQKKPLPQFLPPEEEPELTLEEVQGEPKRVPQVHIRPSLDGLFDDAFFVAQAQIQKYREFLRTDPDGLNGQQVSAFAKLVTSVSQLSREERERAREHDPSQLTDKQLDDALAKHKVRVDAEIEDEDD